MKKLIILLLILSFTSCYTPLYERSPMAQHHYEMYRYYQTEINYMGTVGGEFDSRDFYERQRDKHYREYRKWSDNN